MRKICALSVLAMLLCTVLSSCLGAESPEKFGYVLAIGVDSGSALKYSVSFLLENEQDSEQSSSPSPKITTVEGENIFEAIYTAESALPFRLNFSRTGYIILGFDFAADGMAENFFSVSWSYLRIRTSANLIVSSSTAREFTEGLSYTDEVNIAKLESSLTDFYKRDGLTAMMSLSDFMTAAKSSRFDAVLPLGSVDTAIDKPDSEKSDTTDGYFRSGGMISYTLGAALFRRYSLCGTLSARESRVLMMAEGKMKGAVLQFSRDDGTAYSAEVGNTAKTETTVSINNDEIIIRYDIYVSAILRQDTENADKDMAGRISDSMREQVKQYLENAVSIVFDECKSLNCDAFGVGKVVSKKFSTAREWEEFGFENRLNSIKGAFYVHIQTVGGE